MANTHKRKQDPRSRLMQPIVAIKQIKPQMPRATGRVTRVRFFSLRDEGVETDGDLFLKDGRIIADPADSIALTHMLSEPLRVDYGSTPTWIDPVRQPEEFLAALQKVYHGTYFWAEAVA